MHTAYGIDENIFYSEQDVSGSSTLRFLLGAFGSFFVTFCLIAGMVKLIHVESISVSETIWEMPDPVLVPEEPTPIQRDTRIEPIDEPMPKPTLPDFQVTIESDIQPGIPSPISFRPVGPPGIAHGDHAIVLRMVQPVYPRRAAMQGIEGYVDIGFDVQASGLTHNIQVVGAQPTGIFEKAARAAVKKWRFNPAQENGKPIASYGLVYRIVFEMEK